MYHSVHFDGSQLTGDTLQYLRKHDVVYHSPAYKASEGFPLGNGCFGGMLYHTDRSIQWMQNHTDVIDFGPDGNFQAWAGESEEINTAPVSCGEITISDGMPSFEWIYLKDYEARLNLSEGLVDLQSSTAFSSWKCRAYVAQTPCVSVLQVEACAEQPVERTILFEKWSSPNFFHYYEQIVGKQDKNLNNIDAGIKSGCVYLHQHLRGTDYILAAKLVGEPHGAEVLNTHSCRITLPRSKKHQFKLLTTTVFSNGGEASLDEAISNLNSAEKDISSVFKAHQKAWKQFWGKSFLSLPDDDYLENLYYINLYQLNSCSRGKFPITFAGLWNTYRDSRNWGHFYHWNHQQTYWGLDAAGHWELEENYLNYRFNMLKNASEDAKKVFRSPGAFYSDITNLNGYNALEPDAIRNFTVGPQIAMDFYRHYLYTGDQKFLLEKAYPVMRACADFYCNFLKKEDDEIYRISGGSSCYESYWNNRETVTDRAMIPALLGALLFLQGDVGLEPETAEKYQDILNNLYPAPTLEVMHNGEKMKIFADGVKWDGSTMDYAEGVYPLSAFPGSQISMIYPAGTVSLKDRSTEIFHIAANTARVVFDRDGYQTGPMGCCGHTPLPQVAARLGMGDDAFKLLHHYVSKYQPFPNGLTHFQNISGDSQWPSKGFHPRIIQTEDTTQWEKIHEKDFGHRTFIPCDIFLHCYFETAGNIMAGLHEMLLQSCDGILRVFPAVPKSYSAIFSLWAAGTFKVTSEKNGEDVRYISIHSVKGHPCCLKLPWQEQISLSCGENPVAFTIQNGLLQFETVSGKDYLIVRSRFPLANYYHNRITGIPNPGMKLFENNTLGKERVF